MQHSFRHIILVMCKRHTYLFRYRHCISFLFFKSDSTHFASGFFSSHLPAESQGGNIIIVYCTRNLPFTAYFLHHLLVPQSFFSTDSVIYMYYTETIAKFISEFIQYMQHCHRIRTTRNTKDDLCTVLQHSCFSHKSFYFLQCIFMHLLFSCVFIFLPHSLQGPSYHLSHDNRCTRVPVPKFPG